MRSFGTARKAKRTFTHAPRLLYFNGISPWNCDRSEQVVQSIVDVHASHGTEAETGPYTRPAYHTVPSAAGVLAG